MTYGPVPSYIEDIFKAVRHQSYFSQYAKEFEGVFSFQNDYILKAEREPDMQHLSKSDVECLDYAIAKCKDLDFGQLTLLSHGYAWSSTAKDRPISVDDILKEAGDREDYIDFVTEMISLERATLWWILRYDSFLCATNIMTIEKRELAADIAEGTASIVGEMQAVHLSELLSAARESDLFTDYEKATYLSE